MDVALFLAALQLSAKAPGPAAVTVEYPQEYITSCGIHVWGLGAESFDFPWEHEEYRRSLNYITCGSYDLPETGTRNPTTEPDPGSLGPNKKKGEEKK